ncbi:MAG TPA: VTT domain-containing protein [Catenuloplanes sp.]|jgi:uncharacterized membrane protein YdjX (TVP38/TMEM64 family)
MTVAGTPVLDAAAPRCPRTGRIIGPPVHRRRRVTRLVLVAVGIGVLAAIAAALPLHLVPAAVATLGPAAAFAAAGTGALLMAVMVPRTAVSLACGALLGPVIGASASLGAAMLAAVGTYAIGRWAGHGALTARAGSRLDRLDGWLNRRGFAAVLLVRFLPLAPFGLVGYAYGTTSVRRHHYLFGTLIAALPSTFSYAVIGAAVVAPGRIDALTFVPAIVGLALSTVIILRWRRADRNAAA